MAMQIVKESRKLIKPSVATPPSLRQFKIGLIDELAPAVSVGITLFFSVESNNSLKFVTRLEKSLEKILTTFYPLAGRYVEETLTIDCNDQGAEFIKATCNITLRLLLDSKVNVKLVHEFIPTKIGTFSQVTDPLLSIQVSTFECGGVALGVSFSHKIADASTISTFLNKWGKISREENGVEFTGLLKFTSSSFYPGRGICPPVLGPVTDDDPGKYVTLKLSFSDNVISNLKEKMHRIGTAKWSRVQLVSTLILKGLIGVDRAVNNCPRDCILIQPINLREKTASLIPKDAFGNLCGVLVTNCGITETTEELADLLRDSIKETLHKYSKVRNDDEEGETMVLKSFLQVANVPPTALVIWLSSWCRFPFYEVDFGFGKPIWTSCGNISIKNMVCLMDGIGGNGIEAYVCLEVKDVCYFKEALNVYGVAA